MTLHTLAIWHPGPMEMVVLLLIALLLFGRRLPEVGKSLGKGIVEFRRGLKGVTDDIETESSRPAHSTASAPAPRQSTARPPLEGGTDQRVVHGSPISETPRETVAERPGAA